LIFDCGKGPDNRYRARRIDPHRFPCVTHDARDATELTMRGQGQNNHCSAALVPEPEASVSGVKKRSRRDYDFSLETGDTGAMQKAPEQKC
jgi:hypothetical protein